jgi:hypothetical protein
VLQKWEKGGGLVDGRVRNWVMEKLRVLITGKRRENDWKKQESKRLLWEGNNTGRTVG